MSQTVDLAYLSIAEAGALFRRRELSPVELVNALLERSERHNKIARELDAKAQRLQGAVRYALGEAKGTVSVLVEAARGLEPFDVRLARAAMLEALSAARVTGRFTAPAESEQSRFSNKCTILVRQRNDRNPAIFVSYAVAHRRI